MIHIWKRDKWNVIKITANFAHPNKKALWLTSNSQTTMYADAWKWSTVAAERQLLCCCYASIFKLNINFRTMLPGVGVDFMCSRRRLLVSSFGVHRRPKTAKKTSELFNYIFMCMRLISMSVDDGKSKTGCSRLHLVCGVSMSTSVLHPHVILNETKNHVAYYNHVNVDSIFLSFVQYGSVRRRQISSFHFRKMLCSVQHLNIFRKTVSCIRGRVSAAAPGKIAAYLFLLHFLTFIFRFLLP